MEPVILMVIVYAKKIIMEPIVTKNLNNAILFVKMEVPVRMEYATVPKITLENSAKPKLMFAIPKIPTVSMTVNVTQD